MIESRALLLLSTTMGDKIYPVPIYLHQEIVFDTLAMMEDGFSAIRTLRTTSQDQSERSGSVEGGIGTKNIFSFLDVKFSGKAQKKASESESREESSEKVHTPSSLFAKLRDGLRVENLLHPLHPDYVRHGQFVEFDVRLSRNPLIYTFESFLRVVRMMEIFEKSSDQSSVQNDFKAVSEQVKEILDNLTEGGIVDMLGVAGSSEFKMQVLLTVRQAFARDESLADLTDGDFTVLGKVIRVVRQDDDSINLLRKSSFGVLSIEKMAEIVQSMQSHLASMQQGGFQVPELVTTLKAPAVHVLPIAIYS